MSPDSIPSPIFLNVEFIFSWLWLKAVPFFLVNFFGFLQFLASILVLIALTFLIYSLMRLYEIKREDAKKNSDVEKEKKGRASADEFGDGLPGATAFENKRNEIWENIRTKLLSDNTSDWRLAIIEADIYLDRLLDEKGFTGDTLGDKLKGLNSSVLASLQNAWEAHKIRNKIAHQGSDFVLTMPEARKALANYEIVFRELGAIS